MKQLTIASKEFKKVMQNSHSETMSLSEKNQRKILELTNTNTTITPTFITDLFRHGEI